MGQTRETKSFRASGREMEAIKEAALIVGVRPATLVRNASVAVAHQILESTEDVEERPPRA